MLQQFWDALLERNGSRLVLYQQPIEQLSTGKRIYEVLLRLQYRNKIYSIAEALKTTPIDPNFERAIDEFVFRSVQALPSDGSIRTVNLFASSLNREFYDLARTYADRSIIFELTERTRLTMEQRAIVGQLTQEGYQFWLDDLGCEHGSDLMLLQLPIKGVKICGEICSRVCVIGEEGATAAAIVAGKMLTAKLRKLPIVCESVQSMSIRDVLHKIQLAAAPESDLWFQGYWVKEPGAIDV